MTDQERAMLREPQPRLFGWSTGIVSAACVFALTFLVVLLPAPLLPFAVALRAATAAAAVASVATYVWVQRRERRNLRKQTDLVARESAAGFVNSTVYTVRDAVARTRGPFSDKELEAGTFPGDGTIEARDFGALNTSGADT